MFDENGFPIVGSSAHIPENCTCAAPVGYVCGCAGACKPQFKLKPGMKFRKGLDIFTIIEVNLPYVRYHDGDDSHAISHISKIHEIIINPADVVIV